MVTRSATGGFRVRWVDRSTHFDFNRLLSFFGIPAIAHAVSSSRVNSTKLGSHYEFDRYDTMGLHVQ